MLPKCLKKISFGPSRLPNDRRPHQTDHKLIDRDERNIYGDTFRQLATSHRKLPGFVKHRFESAKLHDIARRFGPIEPRSLFVHVLISNSKQIHTYSMATNKISLAQHREIDSEVYAQMDWDFNVVVIGKIWRILKLFVENHGKSKFSVFTTINKFLRIQDAYITETVWFDFREERYLREKKVMGENLRTVLIADNAAIRAGSTHFEDLSARWRIEDRWFDISILPEPPQHVIEHARDEDVKRTIQLTRFHPNKWGIQYSAEIKIHSGDTHKLFRFIQAFVNDMEIPFKTAQVRFQFAEHDDVKYT